MVCVYFGRLALLTMGELIIMARRSECRARGRAVLSGRLPTCGLLGTVTQFSIVLCGAVALMGAEPGPAGGRVPVMTNLLQLRQGVWREQSVSYPVRLDALILWASQAQNRVFLQDESGAMSLPVDFHQQSPPLSGQRVRVEGNCVAGQ